MRALFILLLVLFSFPNLGFSQISVKGKQPFNLKTMVFPGHNYRIKIDGELQPAVNLFTVSKGKHYIEIWAPHYKQFDTALYFSSKLTVLPVILKKSNELEQLEDALKKSKYHLRSTAASIGGVVLLASTAIYNYGRISDLNVDKIKAENGYTHGVTQYTAGDKNSAEKSLRNARILQGAIYAGIGALTYNAIRHITKSRQITIPVLKEDKSFLIDGGISYTPDGVVQTGLVINF